MVHLLCPRETQLIFKFWILRINCTFNYLTYYILCSSQWKESAKYLKNYQIESKRGIISNIVKNNELISENKIIKKDFDFLSEEYKILKSNCTAIQIKSDYYMYILYNLLIKSQMSIYMIHSWK